MTIGLMMVCLYITIYIYIYITSPIAYTYPQTNIQNVWGHNLARILFWCGKPPECGCGYGTQVVAHMHLGYTDIA